MFIKLRQEGRAPPQHVPITMDPRGKKTGVPGEKPRITGHRRDQLNSREISPRRGFGGERYNVLTAPAPTHASKACDSGEESARILG